MRRRRSRQQGQDREEQRQRSRPFDPNYPEWYRREELFVRDPLAEPLWGSHEWFWQPRLRRFRRRRRERLHARAARRAGRG